MSGNDVLKRDHQKGRLIGDMKNEAHQFRLNTYIGRGSFGSVFGGTCCKSKHPCAIKVEEITSDDKHNLLNRENRIYVKLRQKIKEIPRAKDKGFAQLQWFGTDTFRRSPYRYLVLEQLGESLGKLHHQHKEFSLKTILMIGIQLVDRFEIFHKCTFIHRDVKPENVLIGVNRGRRTLYLIDFGLCKRYIDPTTRKHVPMATGKSLVGTIRYAPLACHLGNEISRKDDLEALGYMLVYFLLGRLPWQGLGRAERDSKVNRKITDHKKNFIEFLEEVDAPSVFRDYLRYLRSLEFEEEPDYKKIRNMFTKHMSSEGLRYDNKFDWIKK